MKSTITLLLIIIGLNANTQDISKCTWLVGTWTGPGFGGSFEEVWSEPDENGIMMGMFRYLNPAGEIQFYEFWLLDSSGMRLKHFNADFSGWEEKSDFVTFNMIETTDTKVSMKSLSYELMENGEMEIQLTLKNEGKVKTEVFRLKRKE
ncbi:MAG: DUF6265 family protein [Marinoscillum sp.]